MEQRRRCPSDDEVARVHESALAFDSHVDTAMRCREEGFEFTARHETGHIDMPRMREGGLDAMVMAVYMGAPAEGEENQLVEEALFRIDWIRSLARKNPETIALALTAHDVRQAVQQGRAALMIGIEGGHIINGSLETLERYHALGARVLTLTHIFHHDWADSSGFDDPLPARHGGLSPFGRAVIAMMNQLGILVDVSHAADETFHDVLEFSTAPVAATHSGCRALCNHRRNLSDAMIEKLADSGGVIQIPFYPTFLDPAAPRKKEKGEGTSLDLLLDHIDHAIGLVGSDHVGLGSDWDGIPLTVDGLEDCSKLPCVTRGLLERGHDEGVVRKVLGENFLRVLDDGIG